MTDIPTGQHPIEQLDIARQALVDSYASYSTRHKDASNEAVEGAGERYITALAASLVDVPQDIFDTVLDAEVAKRQVDLVVPDKAFSRFTLKGQGLLALLYSSAAVAARYFAYNFADNTYMNAGYSAFQGTVLYFSLRKLPKDLRWPVDDGFMDFPISDQLAIEKGMAYVRAMYKEQPRWALRKATELAVSQFAIWGMLDVLW